jgi:hypothetical protein
MNDALMAEALAMRVGIELAKGMGVTRLQVESHSSPVVQMLNNPSGYRSSFATISHGVQELRNCFKFLLFNICKPGGK